MARPKAETTENKTVVVDEVEIHVTPGLAAMLVQRPKGKNAKYPTVYVGKTSGTWFFNELTAEKHFGKNGSKEGFVALTKDNL